jgi:hypothetical protein
VAGTGSTPVQLLVASKSRIGYFGGPANLTRGELPSYLNEPLDELVKLLNEKGGTS